MADIYSSFRELCRYEAAGRSFEIVSRNEGSPVAIIAPHGGTIERGTTELAEAIAADDWGFYSFSGLKKRGNYRNLHITSTRFDEPRGLQMVAQAFYTIAVHGCLEISDWIYLGGLDFHLKRALFQALTAKGFKVCASDSKFPGTDPANICNRNKRGKGVQLEVATELRRKILTGAPEFFVLAESVKSVLREELWQNS